MKILAELRTEVELGLIVYNSTNPNIDVFFAEGWYIFARTDKTPVENAASNGRSHGTRVLIGGQYEGDVFVGGGVIFDDCYRTFEALLADWPAIASQPAWATMKTPEHLAYKQAELERVTREQEELEQRQIEEMHRRRALGIDPF